MLANLPSGFQFIFTNVGVPSTTPGTSVVPGASNAEGSWTQIADDLDITQDIYLVMLWISAGTSGGQSKQHLLDIGIDPAGGSSFTAIINNVICGNSASLPLQFGLWFLFPIRILSGSSVAVRIQGLQATAGTVRVGAWFFGQPDRPELVYAGRYSETIGTITNSSGVIFTPGTSGADGSWTSLGTTTRVLSWWQLCVQIDDASQTSGNIHHYDLAFGDATVKYYIVKSLVHSIIGTNEQNHQMLWPAGFRTVPAGSELWVRGTCSGTPDLNFNAVAVGIGG